MIPVWSSPVPFSDFCSLTAQETQLVAVGSAGPVLNSWGPQTRISCEGFTLSRQWTPFVAKNYSFRNEECNFGSNIKMGWMFPSKAFKCSSAHLIQRGKTFLSLLLHTRWKLYKMYSKFNLDLTFQSVKLQFPSLMCTWFYRRYPGCQARHSVGLAHEARAWGGLPMASGPWSAELPALAPRSVDVSQNNWSFSRFPPHKFDADTRVRSRRHNEFFIFPFQPRVAPNTS